MTDKFTLGLSFDGGICLGYFPSLLTLLLPLLPTEISN
jgi:hypothetical protein